MDGMVEPRLHAAKMARSAGSNNRLKHPCFLHFIASPVSAVPIFRRLTAVSGFLPVLFFLSVLREFRQLEGPLVPPAGNARASPARTQQIHSTPGDGSQANRLSAQDYRL